MKNTPRRVGTALLICAVLFWGNAVAQDSTEGRSRLLTPAEVALADSLWNDVGVVMPESVPPTTFFRAGTCSPPAMFSKLALDSPVYYWDKCVRKISSTQVVGRMRYIDLRTGPPRKTMLAIVVFAERRGDQINMRCDFWFDQGFVRREASTGEFGRVTAEGDECIEIGRRFDQLLNDLLSSP